VKRTHESRYKTIDKLNKLSPAPFAMKGGAFSSFICTAKAKGELTVNLGLYLTDKWKIGFHLRNLFSTMQMR
jgi:hypothetical protein